MRGVPVFDRLVADAVGNSVTRSGAKGACPKACPLRSAQGDNCRRRQADPLTAAARCCAPASRRCRRAATPCRCGVRSDARRDRVIFWSSTAQDVHSAAGTAVLDLLLLLALQAPPARVVGVVRDEATGEPLAGALVSLPDLDRTTSTDAGGRYVLPDVPPGPQHVLVRFIGHTQHALHALVPAGGTLEIDVTLRAEPVRLGTIQVRSPPAIRGLDGADSAGFPDRSMTAAAIRNHPLLAAAGRVRGALAEGKSQSSPNLRAGFTSGAVSRTRPGICSTAFPSSTPITPRAPSVPGTRTRSQRCACPPRFLRRSIRPLLRARSSGRPARRVRGSARRAA